MRVLLVAYTSSHKFGSVFCRMLETWETTENLSSVWNYFNCHLHCSSIVILCLVRKYLNQSKNLCMLCYSADIWHVYLNLLWLIVWNLLCLVLCDRMNITSMYVRLCNRVKNLNFAQYSYLQSNLGYARNLKRKKKEKKKPNLSCVNFLLFLFYGSH